MQYSPRRGVISRRNFSNYSCHHWNTNKNLTLERYYRSVFCQDALGGVAASVVLFIPSEELSNMLERCTRDRKMKHSLNHNKLNKMCYWPKLYIEFCLKKEDNSLFSGDRRSIL